MNKLIVFLFFGLIAVPSEASLYLRNMYFNIDGVVTQERVFNIDEKKSLYVIVDVIETEYDNISKRFLDKKNHAESRKSGLVVTPNRLVIPPGSSVPIRVISKLGDKMETYRVRFRPVNPNDYPELFKGDDMKEDGTISGQLNVLITLGTLFHVNPKQKIYNTKISRDESLVNIVNNGNSAITIDSVKTCTKNDLCEVRSKEIILPKQTYRLEGNKVSFKIIENGKSQSYKF
ncbi:hypothetical protein [Vibrio owensii]|uniref:hypothetical protein n=1 Tax=Vibrio owensii TaxID=696485 RepID=UPI00391A3F6D